MILFIYAILFIGAMKCGVIASSIDEKVEAIKHKYRYFSIQNKKLGYISTDLYIAPGVAGVGVFSSSVIGAQIIIELAPSIMIPTITATSLIANSSVLSDYVYPSPLPDFKLIVMGWGMLYNHCNDSNISWEILNFPLEITKSRGANHYCHFAVMFFTIKDVQEGEELCWNYGDEYWDSRKGSLRT